MSNEIDLNTSNGNGNNKLKDSTLEDEEEDPISTKYQPPKNVPLTEILTKDSDDPSLNKYKQQLIGAAVNVIIEPSDNRKLIAKRLSLVPEDHPEISFDLTGNLDKYKESVISLKEGCVYRIKLEFYVQRDIVSGLKFIQSAYKGPIRTDKSSYMLGSRAPKMELQQYISEKETAPSGMMARGKYQMKSSIIDDDKNAYLKWEWILSIDKEWK